MGAVDARTLMEEMARAEATRMVKARRMTMKLRHAEEKASNFQMLASTANGGQAQAAVQQVDVLLARTNHAEEKQRREAAARVRARESEEDGTQRPILNLTASFQRPEEGLSQGKPRGR